MKTLKTLSYLALFSTGGFILINSCSKDRLNQFTDTVVQDAATPTSQPLASTIEQYSYEENNLLVQHFIFDASEGAEFTAQEGTQFIIQPNSFSDNNGTIYDGSVNIEIKEIYTPKDMILSNKPTMAGDSILESGGEIFIDAKDESGQPLQLTKDKTICAKLPTKNPANDMLLFKGEELPHNEFNWIETTDAACNIEPTDSMYLIYVNFLGWVNVDRYTGNCSGGGCGGLVCSGSYKTNVILYYNGINPGDSTIVFLIFPDHVSAVKASHKTGITSEFYVAKGIPIGTEIIIFALTYSANYTYYMDEYTTTITPNYIDTLNPIPVSETQVLNFLNSL